MASYIVWMEHRRAEYFMKAMDKNTKNKCKLHKKKQFEPEKDERTDHFMNKTKIRSQGLGVVTELINKGQITSTPCLGEKE